MGVPEVPKVSLVRMRNPDTKGRVELKRWRGGCSRQKRGAGAEASKCLSAPKALKWAQGEGGSGRGRGGGDLEGGGRRFQKCAREKGGLGSGRESPGL